MATETRTAEVLQSLERSLRGVDSTVDRGPGVLMEADASSVQILAALEKLPRGELTITRDHDGTNPVVTFEPAEVEPLTERSAEPNQATRSKLQRRALAALALGED